MALLCFWSFVQILVVAAAVPKLKDDTCCVTQEHEWFRAEDHFDDLINFAKDFSNTAYRTLSVLDLFGASQRVSETWQRAGYMGMSFDIKIDPKHDICSRDGFVLLLRSALGLRYQGLLVGAPPCSLQGPCSQSVHKRSWKRIWGDTSVWKVRLSNRIWINTALAIHILLSIRPDLFIVLEQPSSSWGFKSPPMQHIINVFNLFLVGTWMGMFSHDLQKSTHLQTNLREMQAMRRRMTQQDRARINRRFARRQQRRKRKRVYHTHKIKADGKRAWQGGRDLPLSAAFTWPFCRKLLECWENRGSAELIPDPISLND